MRHLIFLATGMFTIGCNGFVIPGLLPGMADSLGSSVAATGQGIAVSGLAYVICAPTFAILLGKKSPRLVLLVALLTFFAGNVLTLLATTLPLHLLSRGISGAGAGLFTPACVAAAIGLFESKARGRILSLVLGASSAGAVIGVPMGLWLSERYSWHAAVGMTLVLAVISFAGLALQRTKLSAGATTSVARQIRLLAHRRVLAIIGVTCLTTTGCLGLYSYAAPLLAGTTTSLSSALFLWSVGGLIGSSLIGFVVDRTGAPKKVMLALLGALVVATGLLPELRQFPVLGLLPFILWGAAGWATVMPQQHVLIDLEPNQGRSLVALNSSVVHLGTVMGTSAGGLMLASGVNAGLLPYFAAGILLVAAIWQWSLLRTPHSPQISLNSEVTVS